MVINKKFVINLVFALCPPDLEDLQSIHQGTFSFLTSFFKLPRPLGHILCIL